MLPDWSDDDDDDDDNDNNESRGSELQPPPSPQSRAVQLERIEEYKSVLESIDYRETTDLNHSLASRAHLEQLVDRYWQNSVELSTTVVFADESSSEIVDSLQKAEREAKTKQLKEMILHHPCFRVSPLLLRWPLLAADVPKPLWTLSDEILAVLERQRRGDSSQKGVASIIADPIDIDIAIPAMVSCQHALIGVLHDLAIKSESHSANSSSSTSRRDSIFSWKDILSTLAMRSDVPESVFKATQNRLESIYGQAQVVPPSSWMSNMGIGGTDMILEVLKRKDGKPLKHQNVIPSTAGVAKRRQSVRKGLDEELLLAPMKKKARYLEQAPVRATTSKRSRP